MHINFALALYGTIFVSSGKKIDKSCVPNDALKICTYTIQYVLYPLLYNTSTLNFFLLIKCVIQAFALFLFGIVSVNKLLTLFILKWHIIVHKFVNWDAANWQYCV